VLFVAVAVVGGGAAGTRQISDAETGVGESGRARGLTESGQTLADVSWSSSNPQIATVGPDGGVVAAAPGVTEIRGQRLGQSASFSLRVIAASDVTSFFFAFDAGGGTLNLFLGQSTGLAPRLAMGNTIYDVFPLTRLAWHSSDPGVVSVSPDGAVVINSIGSSTITATYLGLTAGVRINVAALDHDLFALDSGSASGSFTVGGHLSFTMTVGYSLLSAPTATIKLLLSDQNGKTLGGNPEVTVARGSFQTATLRDDIIVPAGTQRVCTLATMTTSSGTRLSASAGCSTIR